MSFVQELKRRNVFRVAVAYLATSWLLIQIIETILPVFGFSDAPVRLAIIILAIGLPVAVVLSWVYELTPDGLRLDRDVVRSRSASQNVVRKLDHLIIIALTASLAFFAFDKFVLDPARDEAREEEVRKEAADEALARSYASKSIVVLPLEYLGADEDQDHLSDGITEELIGALTKLKELRVISRDSAFSFKESGLSPLQVADQLNVSHVLRGSIRRSNDDVQIAIRLTDVAGNTELWSDTYLRNLDDIFATEQEIASAVASELELVLLQVSGKRIHKTDPRTYELFLLARHLGYQENPHAHKRAFQLYEEVLARDPNYPPAWQGLAEIMLAETAHGVRPVHEGFQSIRQALNKAIQLDPDYAAAIGAFAWISMLYDRDIATAARQVERAMALDPGDFDIISDAAHLSALLGDPESAIAFAKYALARNPVGDVSYLVLGGYQQSAGHFSDAEESIRTALDLTPGQVMGDRLLASVLMMQGKLDDAVQVAERTMWEVFRLEQLAIVHFALGQKDESDRHLNALIENHADKASYSIAAAYAWRGENDLAFQWLENAAGQHEPDITVWSMPHLFTSLHEDSRWQPFLAKIGKSEAQLAAVRFDVEIPDQE